MSDLGERSKTMLSACGPSGAEEDCAAAIGKNDAPTVPGLLKMVRNDLATIEAKHGKLESVKIEVSMPPEPKEDRPGATTGLATYGDTQYRFNAVWVQVNGDFALDRWRIAVKP